MEEESWAVIGGVLPKQWVRHEYRPDYGVDFVVEVFEWTDHTERAADTLSEQFFVQLKSVEKTLVKRVSASARMNVAKAFTSTPHREPDMCEIEAIPFRIETSELLTVERMGPAIPVVLMLVTLDTKKMYFICLNDVIDKIIIQSDQAYPEKLDKTIYIPTRNELTADPVSHVPLRIYAQRSKLYGAFSLFHYQYKELSYAANLYESTGRIRMGPVAEEHYFQEVISLAQHFVGVASRLSIWTGGEFWWPLKDAEERLRRHRPAFGDPTIPRRELIYEIMNTF
ncbi:MAG: DUF4365 domain-containing protein [Isosphaeraceae bacterium]